MVLRKHETRPRAWGGGSDGRSGAGTPHKPGWQEGGVWGYVEGWVGLTCTSGRKRVSAVWRGVCGGKAVTDNVGSR